MLGTETPITKPKNETFADANVSPHEGKPDDLDNEDVSQILSGAKAITGKSVWSANSAAVMQREGAHQRQQAEEKQETKNREALELAHLAEWNAQKTMLGGVEMTNEEAQNARQHICDHADEYAERAVREGRIGEDEKEDYKRTARRIRELKEREGRGTASDVEKEECERLQRSRVGQAAEHDAGQHYAQTSDQTMTAKTKDRDAKNDLRTGLSAASIDDSFQAAPEINRHFSNAVTPDRLPSSQPDIQPPANTRNVSKIAFALE